MRFLLLLLLPALLLAAACGGDDDDASSSTPTNSETESVPASRSPTPTATAQEAGDTETAMPTPTSTPFETVAPTRRAGINADFFAENTSDILAVLRGVIPANVPCPYDAAEVVIDCSSEGYGRIALDLEPQGAITQCQAVTNPDNGALLAVSCNTDTPSLWFYRLVE